MSDPERIVCAFCFREPVKMPEFKPWHSEQDEYGDYWVYCPACKEWTCLGGANSTS